MNLILLDDIKGLGKRGEVKKARDGYARNYLIPNGLAVPANDANTANFENLKRNWTKKENHDRAVAMDLKKAIESKNPFTISMKAGKEGKLYGSVTNTDIAALINKTCEGVDVDKRRIERDSQIKEIGEYNIPINLFRDVTAEIKLRVTDENGNIVAAEKPEEAKEATA